MGASWGWDDQNLPVRMSGRFWPDLWLLKGPVSGLGPVSCRKAPSVVSVERTGYTFSLAEAGDGDVGHVGIGGRAVPVVLTG